MNTNLLLVRLHTVCSLKILFNLLGLSRSSAEALFLNELCHMDGYGCHRYPVKSHRNEDVILSIGGNNLSSFTLQGHVVQR